MFQLLGCWRVACADDLRVGRRNVAEWRWRSAWWATADRAWSRRRLRKIRNGLRDLRQLTPRCALFHRSLGRDARFLSGIAGSCAAREFRRTRRAGRIAAWLPEPRW